MFVTICVLACISADCLLTMDFMTTPIRVYGINSYNVSIIPEGREEHKPQKHVSKFKTQLCPESIVVLTHALLCLP